MKNKLASVHLFKIEISELEKYVKILLQYALAKGDLHSVMLHKNYRDAIINALTQSEKRAGLKGSVIELTLPAAILKLLPKRMLTLLRSGKFAKGSDEYNLYAERFVNLYPVWLGALWELPKVELHEVFFERINFSDLQRESFNFHLPFDQVITGNFFQLWRWMYANDVPENYLSRRITVLTDVLKKAEMEKATSVIVPVNATEANFLFQKLLQEEAAHGQDHIRGWRKILPTELCEQFQEEYLENVGSATFSSNWN